MIQPKQILCLPFVSVLAEPRKNTERLVEMAGSVAEAGLAPDLVVLPELALSGYLLESLVAESAFGAEDLLSLARDLATTGLGAKTEWVIGAPLREGYDIFNAAVVLCGGEIRFIHRKLFLPTYGMFDEGRYFARGSSFAVYEGVLGKTGILICEDAWHMEMAYAASAAKAETVVVISSSPARGYSRGAGAFDSTLTWRDRLRVFADSYDQTYVYCNRSGVEDGILYDGSSFVVDGGGFSEGSPVAGHEKLFLYQKFLPNARHPGFKGDSSRQNDLPLLREILNKLP